MDHQRHNKLFNNLIRGLFSDNSQERIEAANQLGFLRDGRATNMLCRALKEEKSEIVIDKIIEAMGRIGDPKATLKILEAFSDELKKKKTSKSRVKLFIESLINLKDKRALVHIGKFIDSEDDELRELAERAFDIIEPRWRKLLQKEQEKRSFQDIFNIKM